MRRFLVFLTAAAALASFAFPVLAAPLTEDAVKFIEDRLLHAKLMSNAETALKHCREADERAAQYDNDPFYNGTIAKCLAQAERHLISQNKLAACLHFTRALEALKAVPASHPDHAKLKKWMQDIRQDRATLGC